MSATLDRPPTVIPSAEDARLATESSRILASRPAERDLTVQFDDGQVLTLPRSVKRLLSHVLLEMANGNAVTIIPIHAELTTQEAADYLSVRPGRVRIGSKG